VKSESGPYPWNLCATSVRDHRLRGDLSLRRLWPEVVRFVQFDLRIRRALCALWFNVGFRAAAGEQS